MQGRRRKRADRGRQGRGGGGQFARAYAGPGTQVSSTWKHTYIPGGPGGPGGSSRQFRASVGVVSRNLWTTDRRKLGGWGGFISVQILTVWILCVGWFVRGGFRGGVGPLLGNARSLSMTKGSLLIVLFDSMRV